MSINWGKTSERSCMPSLIFMTPKPEPNSDHNPKNLILSLEPNYTRKPNPKATPITLIRNHDAGTFESFTC